jgi:hypothetical protein
MGALLLAAFGLFVLYFADTVPGAVMAIGVNVCLGVAVVFSFILKRREKRPKVTAAPVVARATPGRTKQKRRKR